MGQRLFQGVRDEDDRDATALEGFHEIEEVVGLLRRQRGRRLVENDYARLVQHRAGDLHHLPLGGRERTGQLRGIDFEVQPLEHLPGGVAHLAHGVEHLFAAEHDVLGNGQLRDQTGLLVDHRDATRAGVLGGGEGDGFAVDPQHALRRRHDAGNQLAERRFARTVLAHQGMNLASVELEIGLGEGGDTTIGLGGLLETDDWAAWLGVHARLPR